ncbi:DUF2845 domain-containing protein [uncultured Desulfosarcina sp.]|uniref:DUF2845 domain-containing protein n=1 Tax=uncultured Desulfosarcina sp. TaxID=218289 RepID=UPI0029C955E3|nr:DUF2845 domain-containing protein [uncultured Desulfosarcina sp.]
MKHRAPLFLISLFFFTATSLHAESLLNCGNGGSASLGDLKQEVRLSCGEPESIEIIGYIDKIQDAERIRVMKIEEWIYSVPYYGKRYYYSLVFEGNQLAEIKNAGSQ